jgi:hypothetical protein
MRVILRGPVCASAKGAQAFLRVGEMIPIAASPSKTQLFMATSDACSSSASGRTGCVAEWSCPASGMLASFLGIWIIFGTEPHTVPRMRTILLGYSPMFDTVHRVFCCEPAPSRFANAKGQGSNER